MDAICNELLFCFRDKLLILRFEFCIDRFKLRRRRTRNGVVFIIQKQFEAKEIKQDGVVTQWGNFCCVYTRETYSTMSSLFSN